MEKVVSLEEVRFYYGPYSKLKLDEFTIPVDIDVDFIFPIPIGHLYNVSNLLLGEGDKLSHSIARVIASMPLVSVPVKTSALLLMITGSTIESVICSFDLLRYYMLTLVVLNNFKTASPKYDINRVFSMTVNRLWNLNKEAAIAFVSKNCKIKEGIDLKSINSVKDLLLSIEKIE